MTLNIKTALVGLLLLASTDLALPAQAALAVSAGSNVSAESTELTLTLSNNSGNIYQSGGFTNNDVLVIRRTTLPDADSYTLFSWSDTRAPNVRLLSTDRISPDAVKFNFSSETKTVELPRDGSYSYAVRAYDESGDEIASSSIVTISLDMVAPKITIINPKYNQEIIGNSLIANGTVNDVNLDYYYFILRNSTGETILTSSHIKDVIIDGVIANLDINTFLSGAYDLAFIAVDKAGNQTSITDSADTASFVVLRKGDGASVPDLTPPADSGQLIIVAVEPNLIKSTKPQSNFKLVETASVLGAKSSSSESVGSVNPTTTAKPNVRVLALAKKPASNTSNSVFLAMIPLLLGVVILDMSRRQAKVKA